MSKEQIARAKAVPILDYILSNEPNNVTRVGNEYRLKDHSDTMGNFKRDADGNDKRFGFILPPDDPDSDIVAAFEAPIDCL